MPEGDDRDGEVVENAGEHYLNDTCVWRFVKGFGTTNGRFAPNGSYGVRQWAVGAGVIA